MKTLLVIYLLFLSIIVSGQENNSKDINLIITINDKLIISGIQSSFLFIKTANNKIDTIDCLYEPGKFVVFDETKLKSDTIDDIILSMRYQVLNRRENKFYYYEIDLEKAYFEQSFIVLRIYNLDKWKYKRIYYPLEGKNYTYEIDLPSNSINRIRKR
jgi:hypothetical protein